eukprot:GHVS01072975.1.p1 GENE.GHVS01072975.1~~GHVS01072975.1.p1  ORF type:complete len:682 (+),score=117.88 GHVS01072975.1:331-2376(+)
MVSPSLPSPHHVAPFSSSSPQASDPPLLCPSTPSCSNNPTTSHSWRPSWWWVAVAVCSCWLGAMVLHGVVDETVLNWTEIGTAREKMDLAWSRMESNRESEPWLGLAELLVRGFYLQTDDTERLTQRNTFRPYTNKKKLLHTQGAHVRLKWKSFANPYGYTGLLGEDDVEGTATFSKGSRIVSNVSASWGMGLKLLRDNGPPAASVFCSPSTILGQLTSYNWNMFDAPLCGHVDIFLGAILLQIARKRPKVGPVEKLWTRFGNGPGISNFADLTKRNETVAEPRSPFSLCLRAPLELAKQFKGTLPWFNPIEQLRAVPPNTLLYEVIAVDSPKFLPDVFNMTTNAVKIAELWTQSEFITSRWADNHWTHQHQRFEEDLARRPDWQPYMTLKHLLMDGYGYAPLFVGRESRFGTIEQIAKSFAPGFIGLIQILTNPVAAHQFLSDSIGIKHLQKLAQSVLLGMYTSPNPNEPRSLQAIGEAVELGWGSSLQRLVTEFVGSSLFPGVPLFGAKEEEGAEHPDATFYDGSGEMFDLRGHMEANNVPKEEQEQAMNFITTLAPQLVFDGHFIRPSHLSALRNIVDDPVIRDVGEVVLQQYSEQFGSNFVGDVTEALFHTEGLTDVEAFVRAVFTPLSANREEEEGSRRLLEKDEGGSLLPFRRLLEKLLAPMEKLGEVRLYPDLK